MIRAQSYSPADLTQAVAEGRLSFEDQRLTEMLWRMRLRNWPETLTPEEKEARRAFCAQRLSGEIPGVRGFEDYFNEIDRQAEINDTLVAEGTIDEAKYEARQAVLDALYAWGEALGEYCSKIRNDVDHGNRIEAISDEVVNSFILLRCLIYAMQLKKAGYSDEEIDGLINLLYQIKGLPL